jgi:D-sedoheptulose 7-phosphate isomerase
MKATILGDLQSHREVLDRVTSDLTDAIADAAATILTSLRQGGTLLVFGNGGSAADAQHLAAELVGRFKKNRPAFRALALTTDTSVLTALGNDFGFDRVFARQVEALARPGDVLLGISTSGNSPNVLAAFDQGRARQCRTIGLGGKDGGALRDHCDQLLVVPSDDTARIQEMHITIIHVLCGLIEGELSPP